MASLAERIGAGSGDFAAASSSSSTSDRDQTSSHGQLNREQQLRSRLLASKRKAQGDDGDHEGEQGRRDLGSRIARSRSRSSSPRPEPGDSRSPRPRRGSPSYDHVPSSSSMQPPRPYTHPDRRPSRPQVDRWVPPPREDNDHARDRDQDDRSSRFYQRSSGQDRWAREDQSSYGQHRNDSRGSGPSRSGGRYFDRAEGTNGRNGDEYGAPQWKRLPRDPYASSMSTGGRQGGGDGSFFTSRNEQRKNSSVSIWPPSPPHPTIDSDEEREHRKRHRDSSRKDKDKDKDRNDRKRSDKHHSSSSSRRHRHHPSSSRHDRSSRHRDDKDSVHRHSRSSRSHRDDDERRRRSKRSRSKVSDIGTDVSDSDSASDVSRRDRHRHRSSRSSGHRRRESDQRHRRSRSHRSATQSETDSDSDDDRHEQDNKRAAEAASSAASSDVEVGPTLPTVNADGKPVDPRAYGGALLPGEGTAMASYVQDGKRIPRRGEIGLTSEQIEAYEKAGYVMSGSRHHRMNAVRMRKENQVISAEEKRTMLRLQAEEKAKKEREIVSQFKELVDTLQPPAPSSGSAR